MAPVRWDPQLVVDFTFPRLPRLRSYVVTHVTHTSDWCAPYGSSDLLRCVTVPRWLIAPLPDLARLDVTVGTVGLDLHCRFPVTVAVGHVCVRLLIVDTLPVLTRIPRFTALDS